MKKSSKANNAHLSKNILPAVVGSIAMLLLLVARIAYTEELKYNYLIWNVFLAWLAWVLGCAFLSSVKKNNSVWISALLFVSWVLFLPNTFYLLTDMIHPVLSYDKIANFNGSDFSSVSDGVMMLFDLTLVGFGVWVGWYLGIHSLKSVWNWASHAVGLLQAAIMTQTIILACAYAIYLGRSPRLNSWDVVARPMTVVKIVVDPVLDPIMYSDAWGLTLLFVVAISTIFWSIAMSISSKD